MLDGVELLVKSPGVPGETPLVRGRARARHPGLERGRARLPAPAGTRSIGVTGTNGKTTTSELLGAMFRAAGSPSRSPATSAGR